MNKLKPRLHSVKKKVVGPPASQTCRKSGINEYYANVFRKF